MDATVGKLLKSPAIVEMESALFSAPAPTERCPCEHCRNKTDDQHAAFRVGAVLKEMQDIVRAIEKEGYDAIKGTAMLVALMGGMAQKFAVAAIFGQFAASYDEFLVWYDTLLDKLENAFQTRDIREVIFKGIDNEFMDRDTNDDTDEDKKRDVEERLKLEQNVYAFYEVVRPVRGGC